MFLFETSFLQDYGFLECEAVQSDKYVLALLITQRRIKDNPDLVKGKNSFCPEDGGSGLSRNIGSYPPDYTASHAIRAQCVFQISSFVRYALSE
jgi:hypothetical protein